MFGIATGALSRNKELGNIPQNGNPTEAENRELRNIPDYSRYLNLGNIWELKI